MYSRAEPYCTVGVYRRYYAYTMTPTSIVPIDFGVMVGCVVLSDVVDAGYLHLLHRSELSTVMTVDSCTIVVLHSSTIQYYWVEH